MESEFFIGGAVVLHDMALCRQSTKESVVVFVGNVLIYEFHRFGNFLAVRVELQIVQFEVEHVPGPRIDGLSPNSILCLDLRNPGWPSIGLESLLISQSNQLVSNYFVVLFEVLHPRELRRIPTLKFLYHQG